MSAAFLPLPPRCVYGAAGVLYGVVMPAAGTCDVAKPRPCWTEKPAGFQYKFTDTAD
jgi:hypothetical protein